MMLSIIDGRSATFSPSTRRWIQETAPTMRLQIVRQTMRTAAPLHQPGVR